MTQFVDDVARWRVLWALRDDGDTLPDFTMADLRSRAALRNRLIAVARRDGSRDSALARMLIIEVESLTFLVLADVLWPDWRANGFRFGPTRQRAGRATVPTMRPFPAIPVDMCLGCGTAMERQRATYRCRRCGLLDAVHV